MAVSGEDRDVGQFEHVQELFGLGATEHPRDLFAGPRIAGVLDRIGLGIQRPVELTLRSGENLGDEAKDPARGIRVPLRAGPLVGFEIGDDQTCLVVEQLLEVRCFPLPVGCMAVESIANVVVDAACGQCVERTGHHCECRRILVAPAIRCACTASRKP